MLYSTKVRSYQLYAAIAATLLAMPVAFAATEPQIQENVREQSSIHSKIVDVTLDVISRYHYRNRMVDDKLSVQVLEKYLSALDSNRMFLAAEDIESFYELYSYQLDEALIEANIKPAFEMFNIYRDRVRARVKYANHLVQQDFDFNVNEQYIFDRSSEPWPANQNAIDRVWAQRVKHEALNLHIAGRSTDEIRELLQKRYQSIDNNVARFNSDDVFQIFMNSFTSIIEPHTSYLSPNNSDNFDINMRLSLEGIGAVLSNEGSEYTVVQRLVPGGPADLGDELESGDRIIGVAQGDGSEIHNIIGLRLNDVVKMIRGPRGTVVRLEVLSEGLGQQGPSKLIRIVRNQVRLEQRAARSFIIDIDDRLFGVIDIPSFYSDFAAQSRGEKNYRSTTRDVRKLLVELKGHGVEGLIIDLRSNGGGSLREALDLVGLFIQDGPILQTRTSDGLIDISYDRNPEIAFSKDLVVLVNRDSASASEIFAGAIQDYRRGIIVGETTFGKGTVQNIVNLNEFVGSHKGIDLGRLKTTIAQFYRITGNSNQYLGVTPDIQLPGFGDSSDYGERAYDNALPWDTVAPARYIPLNRGISIEFLREQHGQRMREISELAKLSQRMTILQERSKKKSVSLLESQRRIEHEELLSLRDQANNDANPDNTQGFESGSLRDLDELDIILRETGRIINDIVASRQQRNTAARH